MSIAMIGLGPMGRAMARAYLAAGHPSRSGTARRAGLVELARSSFGEAAGDIDAGDHPDEGASRR